MNVNELIQTSLAGKTNLSKDAVEVLMRVAYDEGRKQGERDRSLQVAEDERERIHGPMFM